MLNFYFDMAYVYAKNIYHNGIKPLIKEEDGAGVIELVLIIVVLIGFVVLFRKNIGDILTNVFTKIGSQAADLYKD